MTNFWFLVTRNGSRSKYMLEPSSGIIQYTLCIHVCTVCTFIDLFTSLFMYIYIYMYKYVSYLDMLNSQTYIW